MTNNVDPIYIKSPDIQWATLTGANTAYDGTGSNVVAIFTAGSSIDRRLFKVRARPLGTNVASVLRLWVNNGSSVGMASNNALLDEITLAATTAIQTAELLPVERTLEIMLPAGYVIYGSLGTAVAAGWAVTIFGGKYA